MRPLRPLHLIGLSTLLLLSGCGRWMGYTPVHIHGSLRDPRLVYAGLVQRTQSMGYLVEAADPQRLSFCVRARLDQRRRLNDWRANFFRLAVQPDGSVWVSVEGRRVREGSVIHRKLCMELTAYLDSVVDVLGAPRPLPVPRLAQR